MTAPASGEASPVAWCGVCDAPAEGCGCASLKTSSPVQEASPVEAAAAALAASAGWKGLTRDELWPEMEYARIALTAGLAGDWLERVLDEHAYYAPADVNPRTGRINDAAGWMCAGCEHPLGPEDGVEKAHIAHQAAAIRAAAGVGL